MIKKELAIVTLNKDASKKYKKQIQYLLGNDIKINLYSFEEDNITFIKEELILLSTYLKYDEIFKKSSTNARIFIPKLIFEKQTIEKIKSLDKNKIIYLYNISKNMALDTITQLYKLGIDNINIHPCYPGSSNIFSNSIILTPGEDILIDTNDSTVIDLGYRILDLVTLIEIATALNIKDTIKEELVQKFKEDILPSSYNTERLLMSNTILENQLDVLLSSIDEGIIMVSTNGLIRFYSDKAKNILGQNIDNMIGKYIGDYLKDINFKQILGYNKSIEAKLIKINDIDINMEIKYVHINMCEVYIIKLSEFYKTEKKQAKLRAQLLDSGNISRYTFNDIIGNSKTIMQTKELAYKMSKSNSSIMITGESGTGKELFAQSIHNTSNRNYGPFVAVNCGTFQESLLQSELFGYEEGAFTGAKKGGKIGLFELANGGTIFLDEIGEMDLNLQAKLLRVIQEKQIRRVGSQRVVDIDVRIIAATNRDLKEQIHQNKFRKDLYYRLNVLPLKVQPLRNREDDAILIFNDFTKKLKCDYQLSKEVKDIFKTYHWEGNIRELRNLAEYFSFLDKEVIHIDDLPEDMLEFIYNNLDNNAKEEHVSDENRFIDNTNNLKRPIYDYIFILEQLKIAYDSKQRIGRKKIYEVALDRNIFLTEQQIRTILVELQDMGMVKVFAGRGGSVITEEGIVFLEDNN